MINTSRRSFLKGTGALACTGIIPVSLVTVTQANAAEDFTFAWLTDAHIQQTKGNKFVSNWDQGLQMAVDELSNMNPKPDFVYFGGDMAQLGLAAEMDHGLDIYSKTSIPMRAIVGEHDYYLDMGQAWRDHFGGEENYSFDHKGVHFVAINSVHVAEEWSNKWPDDMTRMKHMARLDNPQGSPFLVGDEGRAWLAKDLEGVSKDTPVIVLSHSPLQKIFAGWNFWTDDAEEVQEILKPFERVTVLYNHVHQPQANQIDNIAFLSNVSTSWPWPYPTTYAQAPNALPTLILPMNRQDISNFRDGTGWGLISTNDGGKFDMTFTLWNNPDKKVTWADGRFRDVNPEMLAAKEHY